MFDTREIKLPSNGKLGYEDTITIRNLTGADEKIIFSGATEKMANRLLRNCIVEPEKFDVTKLCEQDKFFILMQIRILTYGSILSTTVKCPDCGEKVTTRADLSNLTVSYLDDEAMKDMQFTLPKSGDVIEVKILNGDDINEVNKRVALTNGDRGVVYVLRLAAMIKAINGEEKTLIEKQKYIESLHSRDINHIWSVLNKVKLGVDATMVLECPKCGHSNIVNIEMNQEFFRPVLDVE